MSPIKGYFLASLDLEVTALNESGVLKKSLIKTMFLKSIII